MIKVQWSLIVVQANYQAVLDGRRTFELGVDQENFKVGDIVELVEINDQSIATGRKKNYEITFILRECAGLEDGYCVLALRPYFSWEIKIEKPVYAAVIMRDLEDVVIPNNRLSG